MGFGGEYLDLQRVDDCRLLLLLLLFCHNVYFWEIGFSLEKKMRGHHSLLPRVGLDCREK